MENITLNRQSTWNNIGTDLSTGVVEEAIKLAGLDYEVVKKPIMTIDGQKISGKVANIANGNVLGITSSDYEIVQNSEAFEFANYIGEDFTFEKGGMTHTGMIYLIGSMPEIDILGDKFKPHVIFQNSFNGKYQLAAAITPLRVVCQNQFSFAFRDADNSIKLRHSKNLRDKMDDAQRVLRGVSSYMLNLKNIAEQFSNVKIGTGDLSHVIDMIFPTPTDANAKQMMNIENKKLEFKNAINIDDNKNFQNNAWGIINAYTDYITHHETAKQAKYNDTKFIKTTFQPMNNIISIINNVTGNSIAA